jgi:hypothetical protein
MTKLSRNAPCPCGSGKKYKHCCLGKGGPAGRYSQGDRSSALLKLDTFVGEHVGKEDDQAWQDLWGEHADELDTLDDDLSELAEAVHDMWVFFDLELRPGKSAVDLFLEHRFGLRGDSITNGERAFLEAVRNTSMRLYEVVETLPGVSITLRDVMEGGRITVHERTASRSLSRFDWIVARVVPCGASGLPEIERGCLPIAAFVHNPVRSQLRQARDEFLREHPGHDVTAFYKNMVPFFASAWISTILRPPVPELRNTEGEVLVVTRVWFDVRDAALLERSLEGCTEIERFDEDGVPVWHWSKEKDGGQRVTLGRIELRPGGLTLETNSVERADRGRALIESLAGTALRHRATTHEDLRRQVQEGLRGHRGSEEKTRPEKDEIPSEVQEALVLDGYARHYRAWLDESIPALEGHTPRQAAQDERLRPKLFELIYGLENMYERALKTGGPAYDPSWMWAELGLEERTSPRHPPPLAHERMATLVPGSGELCRTVAEHLRQEPGFDDASTVVGEDTFRASLDLQRFLREQKSLPGGATGPLASLMRLAVNFELHRRKAFWVDETLAYMLDRTDLDVVGRELRLPFPSFAVIFTDRHTLSLAERLVAGDHTCPLSGQILRVMAAYVTEEPGDDHRLLRILFALDALGADLPQLVPHEIRLTEEGKVEAYLDTIAPLPVTEPQIEDRSPVRGLLRTTINAILYATSAGVERQVRRPGRGSPRQSSRGTASPVPVSSDEVYFLPGAIEISRLRQIQTLERVPDGRTLVRRFMVRGHWRRANPSWVDQSMRWIQPYWKGPDLAAVIEHTYKLKP